MALHDIIIDSQAARHIVLAEDDVSLGRFMQNLLRSRGYANVHFAEDGQEALELLASNGANVYLMVLDIVMPKVDGIEVVKRATNGHPFPIGFIFQTGFAAVALSAGVSDLAPTGSSPLVLGKPYNGNTLVDCVHQQMALVHRRRLSFVDGFSDSTSEGQ